MRAVERIAKHGWEEKLDRLVVEAGDAALAFHGKDSLQQQQKTDASPVTEADLAAHRLIVAGLTRLSADVPVISEESFEGNEARAGALVSGRGGYWLVDPLDGTKEFLTQSGEFTVNIALMEHGRPVAGWVYLPPKGLLYKAISGSGAFKVERGGTPVSITTRRFDVKAPVVLVSRSHGRGEAAELAERMPKAVVKAVGSSYKYGLIAEGAADLSVRRTPTKLWDTAAADAVLTEAGGRILGWDGQPLDYARPDLTNPPFLALGDLQLDWVRRFGFLVGME